MLLPRWGSRWCSLSSAPSCGCSASFACREAVDAAHWTRPVRRPSLHSLAQHHDARRWPARCSPPGPRVDRVLGDADAVRGAPRAGLPLVAAVHVPGIILGLALFWLFLEVGVPASALRHHGPILVVAGVISGMPLGVQIIKSGLLQLGSELEEASRIAGRVVVGHLPADRAAPAGADAGGGGGDHVRGRRPQHRQHRAAGHQRQPAAVDPAARLHRPDASWRRPWSSPASSWSSRWPAPCWPGGQGCAAA